jgi:hypothetical protein
MRDSSCVITCLFPKRLRRLAFIFLEDMDCEDRLAQRVAHAYGAEFRASFLVATYYLAGVLGWQAANDDERCVEELC